MMKSYYPMHQFNFPPKPADIKFMDDAIDIDENIRLEIVRNVEVKLVDMMDRLIMDEILRTANEEGITDLFVMDKKFVLDAIREKMERDLPDRR